MVFSRVGLAVGLLLVGLCRSAAAEPDGGTVGAQGTPTPARDPRVGQIHALIDGTLDVNVAPQTLFDVTLTDDEAIELEAMRVRTLLAAIDDNREPARIRSEPSESSAVVASRAWKERLELDRARLAFYTLDGSKRADVLAGHLARQGRPEQDPDTTTVEVDLERARVLEAAKAVRLEAERTVKDEVQRLTKLEQDVRAIQDRFAAARAELGARRDFVLGWQRRVRDAKASDDLAADATYEGLLRQLHTSRAELVAALSALGSASEVPSAGEDITARVPADISTEAARVRRLALERLIVETRREEANLREERSSVLLDEIATLNWERLGLFSFLTEPKRDAVTGLTLAGLDQALAEAEHVRLIFRYHRHIAWQWINTWRRGDAGVSVPWRLLTFAVPLFGALLMFIWGRRRVQVLLALAQERVTAFERGRHLLAPGPAWHLLRLLLKTHTPLEWMLFFTVVFELLPSEAMELVEVQVLASIITWSLAGAVVVNAINVLAQGRPGFGTAPEDDAVGELRLRSLRLVGRTIVVFGLSSVLCERLVGRGTIYNWVSASTAVALLVAFLVLVRWWRGTVFLRLERVRKKTPLQVWMLANRSGWQSFLTAMVGALQLFGWGTWRVLRSWISGFDLARRVHAYLFKREIERLGEGTESLSPIPECARDALHPEQPFESWMACPADAVVAAVMDRKATRAGGVIAVHGARGMGKTSVLRSIERQVPLEAVLVSCNHQTTLASLREAVDGVGNGREQAPSIVLLDDSQMLLRPCIGGLARFDDIVAWTRSAGKGLTWVFAFDATLWPLLRRARDSRPIFDESHELGPWTETQIGALLDERSRCADVAPTYTDLLDKMPAGADESERLEALDAKRAGYLRMLWDHVGGNPGLALEAWRASLACDRGGGVRVRPLQVPDVTPLELLPDTSLFVLRAVLQLAPASVEAVAQATRLRHEEVFVDFRYGKTRGYFEETDGRVRVTWQWLCAVTQVLERRRLLGAS